MMRLSGALALVLLGAASLALYQLKYEVAALEAEHARLAYELAAEHEAIHVLKAEWAFLDRPDRLAELAGTHLDMVPLGADKVVAISDLPWAATTVADAGEGER
ncbi:MAG: hypothetical protein QGF53_06265 [Alphaproteobacteria bacterium]|jgi:hypothetical protein|nr:hypothetical protein [Alphaproteobacteria bacterium]